MGFLFNRNEAQPRIVQVKAKHVNSLKFTVAAVLIVVMVLMTAIIRLSTQTEQQRHENSRLQSQIATLQGEIDKTEQNALLETAQKDGQRSKSGIILGRYTVKAKTH